MAGECVERALAVAAYDEDGPNLGACEYALDIGCCTFGCRDEPACMTSGPWPALSLPPYPVFLIAAGRYSRRLRRANAWRMLRLLEAS